VAKYRELARHSVQAKRVIRGVVAALFAAAVMLGCSTFGNSAVAIAAPGWADFDNCYENAVTAGTHPVEAAYNCCTKVGADWLNCRNHIGAGHNGRLSQVRYMQT
jgi:hypothetical protein